MKKLKAFFAIALTAATLTHSQPTRATVGALVSPAVLVAGIYITAVTGGVTVYGLISCKRSGDESGLCRGLMLLFGVPAVLLGLIVLDGEQGVAFEELSSDQALKLGVSEQELEVYNSEVDQANALLEEVKAELSLKQEPTEKDSVIAWNKVKDLVSTETFSTMQKIVSQQK